MSVDFTTGYQPPGVYVEEDATPLVSTSGLPQTLVALVGPSLGYQKNTEQVSLTDSTAVRLTKQGIKQTSIVITRVDTGAVVSSADWDAVTVGDTTARTDFTDVTLADDVDPVLAFVSYQYTAPDFYQPKRYNNYEDVKDAFGEPLNLSEQTPGDTSYVAVLSPLSLAAKIAFENGASDLVLVATTPPGVSDDTGAEISASHRAALMAGYAKIGTSYNVNVVVPITDGIITADAAGTGVEAASYVEQASRDGYFRTLILGYDPSVTTAPDTLLGTGGFASNRVVMAYAGPSGMQYYNGSANQTLSLGHQYLAAAFAGRLSALPVQKSLTREIIRSFAGIAGVPLSNALKNQYAAAGIAIVEVDRSNRISIRHGVTTDVSSLNTRELSVTRARDALVSLIQIGTESAGLIGQPIDQDTSMSVKGVVAGLLEHAVITGTILAYVNLAVRQRSADPSVIEVKFAYKPSYPLNYIVISFSIDVASGETTDLTATAA